MVVEAGGSNIPGHTHSPSGTAHLIWEMVRDHGKLCHQVRMIRAEMNQEIIEENIKKKRENAEELK